jgi:hypothetical protein
MRLSRVGFALFPSLVACMVASTGRAAQGGTKPLFSDFPSRMLCLDGPLVAMVSLRPNQLVVLRIGPAGIEEPQRLRVNFDDVYGMKCTWGQIELLVQAAGSDRFSRLPFSIHDGTIQQGQPRDIDYSISGKAPTPPEVEDFHQIAMDLQQTRGDWYVNILGVRSTRVYELHFVKTERLSRNGLTTRFTVDLLEEGSGRKVTKSVPLIRESSFEAGD